MDAFIAEVLDEYSVDLNTDATFASFIEDGVLQYRKLTSDPRVLRNLVFCWTWRRILGVWPSKIHVIGAGAGAGNGFEAAMARIAECTLFFGGLDKERGLDKELTGYLEALKNHAFVKAELIEIKPKKQSVIESKMSSRDRAVVAVNYAKWGAAQKWCARQGLTFRVITENDMFSNGRN